MHEDLDITNNGGNMCAFSLRSQCVLTLPIFLRSSPQEYCAPWSYHDGMVVSKQQLRTTYRNADFMRSVAVSFRNSSAKGVYANGRLSFEVSLAPGEAWHCCLSYTLADGTKEYPGPRQCVSDSDELHMPRHSRTGYRRY